MVQENNGELNIAKASRIAPDTTTTTDTAEAALKLDIKKIVLKNLAVSFLDKQTGHHVVTQIERIQSSIQNDSLKIGAGLTGKLLVDYTSPGAIQHYSAKNTWKRNLRLLTKKIPSFSPSIREN